MTRGLPCARLPSIERLMCRRPSPASCSTTPTRRPAAPALREKDFGIWQTLDLERARGAGPGDGLRPGRGRAGARPAPGRGRREPAAALCGDARGAGARRDPGAALPGRGRGRVRVPDPQRRRRLRHRRGPGAGRQDARGARLVPAARPASGTTTRAACATTASRGSRRSTRWSPRAAPGTQKHPGFFEAEVEKAKAGDVAAMFFTSGTTGNPKGVVHTHETLIDRAARRRPLRQAHRRRRSARLPAAGLDRPEHLLLRAVAGLRLRRQLPGVGRAR